MVIVKLRIKYVKSIIIGIILKQCEKYTIKSKIIKSI